MKTVYLLKRGQIQVNAQFFWYDDMVFSSLRKVKKYINQGFEINKGYKYSETKPWFNEDICIEYKCMSSDSQENSKEMKVFFQLKKLNIL